MTKRLGPVVGIIRVTESRFDEPVTFITIDPKEEDRWYEVKSEPTPELGDNFTAWKLGSTTRYITSTRRYCLQASKDYWTGTFPLGVKEEYEIVPGFTVTEV